MPNKEIRRPEQEGDVLGISHAKGKIPRPSGLVDDGGVPKGIEVGPGATGDELDGSPGVASSDMGAGGTGNTPRRRH